MTKNRIYSIRRFSLLLPILLWLSIGASAANGQTKIAYIDASKLLKRMPEAVDAESRLGQLTASWTHEADEMRNELNRKQSEFDRRKLIMTDAERSAAEVELQNLRKKLEDYKQEKYGPNGEIFSQQTTLMKPAYDRLEKAIEEVAHDGGYDYVFDRSSRDVIMLYSNAKYDITLAVARKLNIETDNLTQPLINTQNPVRPGQPANGQTPGKPGEQSVPPGTIQRPTDPHQPPPNGTPSPTPVR